MQRLNTLFGEGVGGWTRLSCAADSFPDAKIAEQPGDQEAQGQIPVDVDQRHVP